VLQGKGFFKKALNSQSTKISQCCLRAYGSVKLLDSETTIKWSVSVVWKPEEAAICCLLLVEADQVVIAFCLGATST
jgi:hypothetical protein